MKGHDMGNILTANVQIKGLRAMLWHAFGPDAIPLEKREKTGVAGNDPVEWTRTVLMTKERQLYLLPTYIFGCLRDGAKHTKKGKGSIQAVVTATLQVMDDRILVDRFVPDPPTPDSDQPVYLHISSVRNPATKARNVRYRVAANAGWSLAFNIMWDKTIVSRNEIEAVIHDAGALCGLGDGRSIGFGRFIVDSFTVSG
jgi:hypothetical protein